MAHWVPILLMTSMGTVCVGAASSTAAWVETESLMEDKDYDALVERAKELGEIQIIVGLTTESETPSEEEVRRVQDAFVDSLAPVGENAKEVRRFRTIPYVVLRVNETGLSAVTESPLVKSIEEDTPVPPTKP